MKEREKIVISGLVTLLLLIWIGFLFHADPSFAGSGLGLLFGIVGTILMLVPFLYLIIKRVKKLKKAVTKHISMRSMLAWHIYAGVIGPIFVVIHSGHKFESPIGIALIAMTLIVVLSGFIGRYLMSSLGREIREKKATLDELMTDYEQVISKLAESGASSSMANTGILRSFFLKMSAPFFQQSGHFVEAQAIRLSESIADVEYAIRTHQTFKNAFSKWLKLHILISSILYFLIALHIFAEFYYGLRWLD